MQAVIFAGGFGTRISEESHLVPKPMITIGGKPILVHIMEIYSKYGINNFLILAGYKAEKIKEYFSNFFLHQSDVTFDLSTNVTTYHRSYAPDWRVTIVDTGLKTQTAGRLKLAEEYLEPIFHLTYGDGVSSVDIKKLESLHHTSKSLVTLTAVQPSGRFGALEINSDRVTRFVEKPIGDNRWINGGFFVVNRDQVLPLIDDASNVWESDTLETLSNKSQLGAYVHKGFWSSMDTLRDREYLEKIYNSGDVPWY